MIIPIKCVTCGKVIADKYRYYQQEVVRIKINERTPLDTVVYFNDLVRGSTGDIQTDAPVDKAPEARVMDELGLTLPCCRRHFMTHVDID